jgi:hypothetical protein
MESYLKNLSSRLLRISRASLDIGTARKLRELSREISEKADECESNTLKREGDGNGNHRAP